MPLINLRTDLKSLKYGKDTPGGGYSGQPYIQAKIPDGLTAKSPDFLLRNGYLAPVDALTDVKRLAKMFGDLKSPNGLLFIAKQNILSNSAVRTQGSGVLNEGIYTPLSTLAQAGVVAFGGHLNKQGINPLAPTGAYANGVSISALARLDNALYSNVIKADNQAALNSPDGILRNRLYALTESKILNNVIGGFARSRNNISDLPSNILEYRGGPGAPLGVGTTNIRFADQRTGINNSLVTSNPNYFYGRNTKQVTPGNYLRLIGGAVEDKGVSGKYVRLTNARLVNAFNDQGKPVGDYFHNVYEPAIEGNTWPKNTPLIYANNTFTYTQEDIIQSEVNLPSGNHLSPKIQDFRKVLRDSLGVNSVEAIRATTLGATPIAPDYNTKNIETRVNIGSKDGLGPGSRANKSYASYSSGVIGADNKPVGAQDLINALPIYRSRAVDTELPVNDLVKFRIAAIDGSSPNFKTFMHFRAFIDSFSDSYNADWGSVRYLGRGEKFYNYNGFDRTISLSFTVAALSKPELIPMYKKLNYLASNLTPDYSPYGYMRGPLVQLTMGGYLYEQVGFITSLTYDIPNDTPWEIGINDTAGEPLSNATAGLENLQRLSDSSVKELPHRITVSSFQFTPIHDFVPSKQGLEFNTKGTGFVTDYGPERYIALRAVNNNYDSNPQDL
jgi:hypothetical protein